MSASLTAMVMANARGASRETKAKKSDTSLQNIKINTNANTKEGHKRSKYKDNYSGNVYF